MEHINQFNKGLNKDTSELFQPAGTSPHIKHFVQIDNEGGVYSLINESGVKEEVTTIPTGYSIIGQTVLDNDIIVVLVDNTNNFQVGIINGFTLQYERKVPQTIPSKAIPFTLTHPVDCTAKKTYSGDRILYYTDNNIPFGAINLDNPGEDASLFDSSNLIKNIKIPFIVPTILKDNGSLYAGVYQFSLRYISDDLSETVIVGTTNPIPIVNQGDIKIGDEPDTLIRKTIVLEISNLDTNFNSFQLIVHRMNDAGTVLNSYSLPVQTIEGNTKTINFSSIPTEKVLLDLAEVRKNNISYDKAACIEQIDNRLVLANLSESNNAFAEELQNIANNIQTSYTIKEELHTVSNALLAPDTFEFERAVKTTEDTITFYFNDSLSLDVEDDSISIYYTNVLSSISVQAINSIGTGDIITILGKVFQFINNGTPTSGQILITNNSNEESIAAIYNKLNADTDLTEYLSFSAQGDTLIALYKIPGVYTSWLTHTTTGLSNPIEISTGAAPIQVHPSQVTVENKTIQAIFDLNFYDSNYYFYSFDAIYNKVRSASITNTGYNELFFDEPIDTTYDTIVSVNNEVAYKDEFNTTFYKGYKRGETYSFALKVNFKDASDSYCYHIPGNDLITTTNTEASTFTKRLGTYISTNEYPANQGLPGTRTGDASTVKFQPVSNYKIRHHIMPTLEQEPHIKSTETIVNGKATTTVKIRILGLSFRFFIGFSAELKSRIQSFSIVRQSREEEGNKSYYTQGIGFPMQKYYYTDGNTANEAHQTGTFGDFRETVLYPRLYRNSEIYRSDVEDRDFKMVFNSPELHFKKYNPEVLKGMSIQAVRGVYGRINKYNNTRSTGGKFFEPRFSMIRSWNPVVGSKDQAIYLNRHASTWNTCIYEKVNSTTFPTSPTVTEEDESIIEFAHHIPYNYSGNKEGFEQPIKNINSLDYFAFSLRKKETNGTANLKLGSRTAIVFEQCNKAHPNNAPLGEKITTYEYEADYVTGNSGDSTVNILEIINKIADQYGTLDNSSYLEIYRSINIPNNNTIVDDVFGGDIFINLFTYACKFVLPGEDNTPGALDRNPDVSGLDIRSTIGYYAESTINTEYRHEYIDDNGTVQTKFYPLANMYDTLSIDPSAGDNISYNTQYSLENKIKEYYTNYANTSEFNFKNRLIYSDNAGLDAIVDNYRLFPVNNYQDIPKNKGEITDLFVLNDTIFAHTPKSLFRLFNKNNSSLTTSNISEVILGTGDAFAVDAQETVSFKSGYAGSISKFAGVHTPMGYIFPDALQGKIFLFNGTNLKDISETGLINEFNSNLSIGLITSSGYIDNPFTGLGINAAYDFELKRYIITKKGYKTFSYSFIGNCWLSEHDYKPDCYIALNNKLYLVDNTNNKFYRANAGDKGDFKTFTNGIVPSELMCVINTNPLHTKIFDNIAFHTNSYTKLNVYQPLDTFNTLICIDDINDNIELPIEVNNDYEFYSPSKIIAKFKNNEYRIAIPRKKDESRFKDKFLKIKLVYNNLKTNRFIVNLIQTTFRLNKL
ncbi:MAG: hypothetical protein WC942_04985 [Clostridia bacterium]|jgi:hypothetical protein